MKARRLAALLALALLAFASGAGAADPARVRLRYGWTVGQVWRATYSLTRELGSADAPQHDRGVARFEYNVQADSEPGALRLEARMLSQETAAGVSPLDFSAVVFRTRVDAQGRQQGSHYAIGEAQPPSIKGVESDPVAYRRMLRQVASAWRNAAFWFPELPERSLSPGEAFVVREERDLGGEEPGVSLRIHSTSTYRLLAVEDAVARFHVEQVSAVAGSAADSAIESEERAEGEALFDLALGMWTRQQLVSSSSARYSGAQGGAGSGQTSVRSTNSVEMQRVSPAS